MISLDDSIVGALLDWFDSHGVAYPWAVESDPWAIWVSEVMLQQTTVGAVEPRYRRWMKRFPNPESLAEADEEEVLREWEGLGYYSRARNLASAAREICGGYGGRIPSDAAGLKKLPGVGEYIASAVASFAFGERKAAIDANGRRIAQRLSASETWDSALEHSFRSKIEELMPVENPGRLNAAVMQLGQQVCTPRNPDCGECPLSPACGAREQGRQGEIPPRRRQEVIQLETRLALLMRENRIFIQKRTSGIGRGLWTFPSRESLIDIDRQWRSIGGLPGAVHCYTRYRETLIPEIYAVKQVEGSSPEDLANDCLDNGEWAELDNMAERPMPSVYRRITEQLIDYIASSGGN